MPGTGEDISACPGAWGDSYPKGHPDGLVIQDQMKMFAAKGINFTFYRIERATDLMIKVMRENYDSATRKLNVIDLLEAIKNKSYAEVSQ